MMTKISYILFDFFVGVWSLAQGAGAANFEIRNQCAYTVWAAGLPGGGAELQSRQSWRLGVAPGTRGGRFWGRTGCNFDQSGRGSCQTGDCGGLKECQISGKPPTTLVEYTLTGDNNMDTYDISLVNGFNLRVSVHPSTSNGKCHDIACNSDITSMCPSVLKVEGGCNSACDAIMPHNDLYCCTNAYKVTCPPNDYSKFFKQQCPQAYSYAKDDPSSTFVCPVGTDYTIVFCP